MRFVHDESHVQDRCEPGAGGGSGGGDGDGDLAQKVAALMAKRAQAKADLDRLDA